MLDELTLLRAMNGIHEEDVVMAGKLYFNENTARKTSKRLFTLALAAALLLALGAAAYAVWSIHISRQQDLRSDLKIEDFYFSYGPGIRFLIQQLPLHLLFAWRYRIVDGKPKFADEPFHFVLSFNIVNY